MKLIQSLPLLATLIVAACTTASPGATTTPGSTIVPSSIETARPTAATDSSAEPTDRPTATATPGATASNAPSQTASASPSAAASFDRPPEGALGYADFADAGWLGSYCWHGTCADVPAVPEKDQLPQVVVPGDETLIFSLDDGSFVRWIAQYGADDSALTVLGEGGEPLDPDAATATPEALHWAEFDSPPSGDWLVRVQVFFADGDASYFWHVIVE